MKSLIIIFVTSALIIVFSVWTQSLLYNDSKVLTESIDELEAALNDHDWETASLRIRKLQKNWRSMRKAWLMFVHHEEIDNIDIIFAKAYKQIELKTKKDAATELFMLRQAISMVPERSRLSLVNLL